MTSRLKAIAALIAVGSALAATPILAAVKIEPNPGAADLGDTRQVITFVPGHSPTTLPSIDSNAISRGLDLIDEEEMLSDFGSVSRHVDGTVVTTGPSDAIRAAIAAEFHKT